MMTLQEALIAGDGTAEQVVGGRWYASVDLVPLRNGQLGFEIFVGLDDVLLCEDWVSSLPATRERLRIFPLDPQAWNPLRFDELWEI